MMTMDKYFSDDYQNDLYLVDDRVYRLIGYDHDAKLPLFSNGRVDIAPRKYERVIPLKLLGPEAYSQYERWFTESTPRVERFKDVR